LHAERDQLAEQLRRASPRFADLHYPQPLDLVATRQALDAGTTLLSYAVSQEQSVLFVVQPMGYEPGLSVFTIHVTEKSLRAQVEAFRMLVHKPPDGTASVAAQTLAQALYELLLRPAEPMISTSQRLVLIPDGPLHLLPFAALMRAPDQYVIDW